jgi:4-hydroxybenzoate polyprenyltransferase
MELSTATDKKTSTYKVNKISSIIKLLRPEQWVKNGFVLVGFLFSEYWTSWDLIIKVLEATLAFCLISSSIYVFNDMVDIEKDKLHPKKKFRPLASGSVTIRMAYIVGSLVFILGLILGYCVSYNALAIVLIYCFMNILYSKFLKRVAILDVFIISAGFVLRILMGTVGVGIPSSEWLIICGIMISLFIGFGKRRAELIELQDESALHRTTLDEYSVGLLDQFMGISAACTIITYGLYTVDPRTVDVHGTNALIYTLPFVIYGIFRYLFNVTRNGSGGSPAEEVLKDPHIITTVLLWGISIILVFSL